MTVYMNQLFRKSNSSLLLSTGKALTAEVSRFKDSLFLIDAGIGTPKLTTPEELQSIPQHLTKFQNKVGFLKPTSGESPVKTQILERLFMDIVAGDPAMKERAMARCNETVGSTDNVPGEPAVLLPRRFLKNQAWIELRKTWQLNKRVRGVLMEKVRGGYSVAIAGYIAFLPYRQLASRRRLSDDNYLIESIDSKRKKITVF